MAEKLAVTGMVRVQVALPLPGGVGGVGKEMKTLKEAAYKPQQSASKPPAEGEEDKGGDNGGLEKEAGKGETPEARADPSAEEGEAGQNGKGAVGGQTGLIDQKLQNQCGGGDAGIDPLPGHEEDLHGLAAGLEGGNSAVEVAGHAGTKGVAQRVAPVGQSGEPVDQKGVQQQLAQHSHKGQREPTGLERPDMSGQVKESVLGDAEIDEQGHPDEQDGRIVNFL